MKYRRLTFDEIKGGEFYDNRPKPEFGFLVKFKDSVLSFLISRNPKVEQQIHIVSKDLFKDYDEDEKAYYIWQEITDGMITNINSKYLLIRNIFKGIETRYVK